MPKHMQMVVPVMLGNKRFQKKREKNKFQRAYTFLPFFFSTLHQPPVLGVGAIIASWFSIVFTGCSLLDFEPSDPWVRLIPLTSSWDSCCCFGIYGPKWITRAFSSCVYFYPICVSGSIWFSVGFVFMSSSSNGSVCCRPLGFFCCFLFLLGPFQASGQAY